MASSHPKVFHSCLGWVGLGQGQCKWICLASNSLCSPSWLILTGASCPQCRYSSTELYILFLKFFFKFVLPSLFLFLCECTVPPHACGGQKIAFWSDFSPPATRAPETKPSGPSAISLACFSRSFSHNGPKFHRDTKLH